MQLSPIITVLTMLNIFSENKVKSYVRRGRGPINLNVSLQGGRGSKMNEKSYATGLKIFVINSKYCNLAGYEMISRIYM